jgi:hypothetical protein
MPKQLEALKAHLLLRCGVHVWVLTDIFKLCEDKELLPSGEITSSIIPHSETAKKTDTETFIYHVTADLSLTKTTLGSLGSRQTTSHRTVIGLGLNSYLLVFYFFDNFSSNSYRSGPQQLPSCFYFFNSYTFYFLVFNTIHFLLHYCNANFSNILEIM